MTSSQSRVLQHWIATPWIYGLMAFCLITGCQGNRQQAPEGFIIHPEFRMEAAAKEPLIYDPVDMEFDEKGNTFVLEMPGYPLRDEDSRLIQLVDENRDGIYDRRIVFADSLGVASAFMPYREGMLVAAPPHLLFLRDTDNDGRADYKEILMSGFSAGNLQHNFNGLTYGLDNWIYAANGGNSGQPYFGEDFTQAMNLRGDDFRFRLNPNQMERVGESSGGFELAFDDWGHLFETHNLEHVSNLVFEGRYTQNIPVRPSHALTNISDHEENGLSRIYPIGEQETRVNHPEQSGYFSCACGITFYGGNAFPRSFNDHLFVADCVLNLIHLDVLKPNKATFSTSRMREKVEFLASEDRSFRPVNMATGPDGAFYVIDMYREVIEHPEWIPDEMEVHMDLAAGKEKGRIYRITPRKWSARNISLDREDLSSLIQALSNKNQWVRMTAQRLLVEEENDDAASQLTDFFRSTDSDLGRMHALWTLQGLDRLTPPLLIQGLADPSAGVRENALKMAELHINHHPELIDAVTAMSTDPDDRVRMQAALTISVINQSLYSQRESDIIQALKKIVSHDNADQWTAMAVAAGASSVPHHMVTELANDATDCASRPCSEAIGTLCRLIGKNKNLTQINQILDLAGQSEMPAELKEKITESIAEGYPTAEARTLAPKDKEMLIEAIRSIERNADVSLTKASTSLRRALGLPVSAETSQMIAEARSKVLDMSETPERRLQYLKLIGLDEFGRREGILYSLLDNSQPLLLQREALTQLWSSADSKVGEKLLAMWPNFGPEARRYAGNILLYNASNHDLLLTAIENRDINLGELNLDLERRRVLLFSKNESIKARAEALFTDAGVVTRREAIEKMRPAIDMEGDIVAGKEVFMTHCSQCHQYGEFGISVGPALTEINRKSKESLLHDILDPNAAVDTRYLNYQVKTRDGRIITGMVERETDSEVSLKIMGGTEFTISKSEIDEFNSLGISFMMEGLEGGMSPQDMANLLEFLQQS